MIDNWHTKGHTKLLSNVMSRYKNEMPSPNSSISGIDELNNWHTKGHTNSYDSRSYQDM